MREDAAPLAVVVVGESDATTLDLDGEPSRLLGDGVAAPARRAAIRMELLGCGDRVETTLLPERQQSRLRRLLRAGLGHSGRSEFVLGMHP